MTTIVQAVQTLAQRASVGVYQATDNTAQALLQAAPAAGLAAYRINLTTAHNAETLHRVLERALRFPNWYGRNWDALLDCLTDMSWNEANGYLLVFQHAEVLRAADPACFATLLQVLADSATAWQEQDIAFWAILTGTHPELPTFEACA